MAINSRIAGISVYRKGAGKGEGLAEDEKFNRKSYANGEH